MGEKNEGAATFSRRTFLKGAAATVAALTMAPEVSLVKAAEQDLKSPEFFRKEISDTLKRGNKINIALGNFRISNAEKLDHFLSKDALTTSLKDAPFVESNNSIDVNNVEEIQNPLILEQDGIKYMVYNSKTDNRIEAVTLTPENWTNITRVESDGAILFDKDHQDIFQTTRLTSSGFAETNLNSKTLHEEMFCRDDKNELVVVMRQIGQKSTSEK